MTAPGWYRDPWRAARARWFDGRRWTDHTGNPAGRLRRLGPLASLTASDPPPEASRQRTIDPDRRATWSLALGILAIVCSFSLVLAPLGVVTGAAAIVAGVTGMRDWIPRGRALVGFCLGVVAFGFGMLLFGAAGAVV